MTSEITRAIIAEADAAHAAWPHYRNHWSGSEWFLVRITHRVTTKTGRAFEKGDITLAQADRNGPWLTAYSRRNRIDTSVPALWAERI